MKILPAGSRIERFQLIRVLGKGSMGVVYLATDPRIGRPIALKTFHPEGTTADFSRAEMEDQFLREARLAGRLQHPNIVTVFDVGRARDVPFIVMEYVDGETLKALVAAHVPISLPEALWIVGEVARALGHAHEKSVLHRDIKPGNILVTAEGAVKVTDFGVGKLLAGVTSAHSRKGMIVGSPAYMSPEQIREDKLDPRSDLFSLGVVAYELLTGARPFAGESLAGLGYQILNATPSDPRSIRPELPAESADVFRRLLAKLPNERPADAAAFLRELERLAPTSARVDAPSPAVAEAIGRLSRERQESLSAAARAAQLSASSSARRIPEREPNRINVLLAAVAAAAVIAAVWLGLRGARPVAPSIAPGVAAAPRQVTPAPAPPVLPTPGSARAGSPLVGAPRSPGPADISLTRDARGINPALAGVPGAVERVYRTRGAARFAVQPEQTRIWVDGRYVGIADDWDGWGGGGYYPFAPGLHRVRLELPGYRTIEVAVFVTPDAARDRVKIEDRLDRLAAAPYTRRGGLDARTRGLLELDVDPPETLLSAGGRRLGRASAYGPGKPLRLSGPAVHDVELSAPNHARRVLRVLVSPNAGADLARVKVRLKKGRGADDARGTAGGNR